MLRLTHRAQLWPVDAVIGENGAFIMEKKGGYLSVNSDTPMQSIVKKQAKLKKQVIDILANYSNLNLTLAPRSLRASKGSERSSCLVQCVRNLLERDE
jgi:hypothetical protein